MTRHARPRCIVFESCDTIDVPGEECDQYNRRNRINVLANHLVRLAEKSPPPPGRLWLPINENAENSGNGIFSTPTGRKSMCAPSD